VKIRIIAVIIFGGLFAPAIQADEEQERAAKAIKKAGGYVSNVLGVQPKLYTQLHCYPDTDIDAVIKEVRHFPDLQSVRISKLATDEHLKALAFLPHLRHLTLDSSEVSDAGMKSLASHKHLFFCSLPARTSVMRG
jgi:hypothetical protein